VVSESSHTLSSPAVALSGTVTAKISTYLYLFLVISNLTLLTYEFLFKEWNKITSIVNYRIDFGPILVFFAGVGITVLIVNRILPDNSGTRRISVKFWRIIALLFLVIAAADFFSTSVNLRYVHVSYLARYGPLHIAAAILQTLCFYFTALCLVSRSPQQIPAWIRTAVVLGNLLMIDGLASGLLGAVTLVVLFPAVLRPGRVAFVAAALAGLFGYSQYEKTHSLEQYPYFQSFAGIVNYAGWFVERFATHALTLNYYLSHANEQETDKIFWEVTSANLERRLCLIERLVSAGPACPAPGRYKSFASYNFEIMEGQYDAYTGMSPGLFAAAAVIFGSTIGAVIAGLVIAIVGHGLQSVYRGGGGVGLIGIFALIYLLRGVLDDNADVFLLFSETSINWLAFILALTVGTSRVRS
jgi:hypothetical protein